LPDIICYINFLKNYCFNKTLINLNDFIKKNKLKKIALWYSDEQPIIKNIFTKIKTIKLIFINEESWNYNDKKSNFHKIYKFNPDAIFIGDLDKSDILINEIKNRIHLDEIYKIVYFSNNKNNYKNYINFEKNIILNKILIPKFIK